MKKENEVAKKQQWDLANMTKSDVPALLEEVNRQISKLRGGMPKEPQTTGELPGFGYIKNINKTDILIMAHSSVVGKARAYAESAKAILPEGIKTPPFKIAGSTEKAWVDDIKSRILVVANKEALDTLNAIKKEVEQHLSAEDKLAKSLSKIGELLSQ